MLTATMKAAVATWGVQNHHVVGRKTPCCWIPVYTSLLDPALNAKRLPAPIHHLRHEWDIIECAIVIECRQYLLRRAHQNLVPDTESVSIHDVLAYATD